MYPQFSDIKMAFPSYEEQEKIANLLTFVDNKIELIEKKYQTYLDFKKYLMQQIFTQKLRFNFDDEWKQYKLKDVLTVKSSSISINQLEENTGDYPLYGASGFLKNIDFCEMDVDYISIVKDGSGVGNLSFHEKNSSIVNTSQYLLPKKNFNINFLYYLLQTINLMKYVNGSSIPHIYFKDYCIEKINIPSLDEQEKIGKLFVDVDITMENLNKNINATQEFKKGLLQQMFVVRINWRCNFKLAKSPSFNKHLLILKNKIIFIIIELIIGDLFMKIEKDAENILNKFSKTLENIPDLEETWYITDNLNLTREDKSHEKHPEKILRNAHIDKEGKLVVKRADWVN